VFYASNDCGKCGTGTYVVMGGLILVGRLRKRFDLDSIRIVPASSQNWCGAVQPGQFRNALVIGPQAMALASTTFIKSKII
jgi:hypothetical protein